MPPYEAMKCNEEKGLGVTQSAVKRTSLSRSGSWQNRQVSAEKEGKTASGLMGMGVEMIEKNR